MSKKQPLKLDRFDAALLREVQRDAAQSTAELAAAVGLSASPCWRRLHRLEQAGIIRKRVAVLDHRRLGIEITAFVSLNLSQHGRENLEQFERAVRELPEVLECYTVTGQMDYMLKILTRDIEHYESFLRDNLMQLPFIREMHSSIAVSEIKDTTELPLTTQLAT